MQVKRWARISFLVIFCSSAAAVFSQPTWTLDPFGTEKKPKQYEEKKLGSEKTADKKFTIPRRFIQNNVTHYNYFFNANNKLNAVIERATISQKDDYAQLLSYYPFSLDNTASQQVELDSVIYKSTAGILLHDLRSDWVDNLYLLIGKSFFFRKEFDSAALTFQFINYNLFPRNKNEDENRTVGGNSAVSSNMLSIADKEKRNILQKVLSRPPSRNEALIWLVRTFIEQEAYGDAAGMINILHSDPNLPDRLRNDLDEVTGYWFFRQKIYDSAAIYLEKGISNADNKANKSRSQFLLGQLFEMAGKFDKASAYYSSAAKNTTDPLMDIYANLNRAKMLRNSDNPKELESSISNLLRMARQDKYETYRDIIYNSAGQIALHKPDTAASISYFTKSLSFNENNPSCRNKTHLELGKIAYEQKKYKKAADHYDSLDINDPSVLSDSAEIADRKFTLRGLADKILIIEKEDSIQKIAAMPPAERDVFVKKLSKKLLKEKGVKTEDDNAVSAASPFASKTDQPADLFQAPTKGEWYFYSASMKSKGFNDFKAKWGKREDKDNWRRKAALSVVVNDNIDIDNPANADMSSGGASDGKPVPFSYDALMADLPLTPELLESSNSKIALAYIELGKKFENELREFDEAINVYDTYLQRFPGKPENAEAYLGLYHCYLKIGDKSKAQYYKNILDNRYGQTKFAKMVNDPASLQQDKKNPIVTEQYQSIYNLFIEGNFQEAIRKKKAADSLYGSNYWTPQLLYIEAVHYIREKQDSQAIVVLNNIVSAYPGTSMAEKAQTMSDVVKKRNEIEAYLTNLNVTRAPEEDKFIISNDSKVETVKPTVAPVVSPIKKIEPPKNITLKKDSAVIMPPSLAAGVYRWEPLEQHVVIMMLDKVDRVYVNEARNAMLRFNREKNYPQVVVNKDVLDAEKSLLVFGSFENAVTAISYYEAIKKAALTEMSWLQPSKYSFLIISNRNFELLKTKKDTDNYRKLLNIQYPGRF